MKFEPFMPRTIYEDTPRKRKAQHRSQRQQREALPLLAELIAERQPDADTVMTQRAAQWAKTQQEWRNSRAAAWRAVRRLYFSYDPELRAGILKFWNAHRWFTKNPGNLHYILKRVNSGGYIFDKDAGLRNITPIARTRDCSDEVRSAANGQRYARKYGVPVNS